MIAYLSGAMENAKNEGSAWRNEISIWLKENINHSVIDPVQNSQRLRKELNAENYRQWKIN